MFFNLGSKNRISPSNVRADAQVLDASHSDLEVINLVVLSIVV
jgi:hypothetical protein